MSQLIEPNFLQLESYARDHSIDASAPVAAEGAIDIRSSGKEVWQVLTDFANWSAIRADVMDVTTDGPVAGGMQFTWGTKGARLRSRLVIVEPSSSLTYVTGAPGLEMVHVYHFELLSPNITRLRLKESMNAMAVAPQIGNRELEAGILSWLNGIKDIAEQAKE